MNSPAINRSPPPSDEGQVAVQIPPQPHIRSQGSLEPRLISRSFTPCAQICLLQTSLLLISLGFGLAAARRSASIADRTVEGVISGIAGITAVFICCAWRRRLHN